MIHRHVISLLIGMTCFLSTGCIPWAVEKAPPVIGRVTDARTHRPIAGAEVSLPESGVPGAATDADGRFSLPLRNKFGFVVLLPFDPAYRTVPFEVHRKGYRPLRTTVPFYVFTAPKPLNISLEPGP
jgi:hypothetical protein